MLEDVNEALEDFYAILDIPKDQICLLYYIILYFATSS